MSFYPGYWDEYHREEGDERKSPKAEARVAKWRKTQQRRSAKRRIQRALDAAMAAAAAAPVSPAA